MDVVHFWALRFLLRFMDKCGHQRKQHWTFAPKVGGQHQLHKTLRLGFEYSQHQHHHYNDRNEVSDAQDIYNINDNL